MSSSIVIERVQPEIDSRRWPINREVGDRLEVSAAVTRKKRTSISGNLNGCWERVRTRRRSSLVCPINGGSSPCISVGMKRWD
ncbi:MAG: DUF3416 domain-containing protein [Nitrospiraceae bacterium]|nr:MAG: DUF3416 domain-containing protein [Nitrospiraceae bacterium]